jgi:hypothetical protein
MLSVTNNAIMLNVVMLSVIMLNVVAPPKQLHDYLLLAFSLPGVF